jgi:hypothetical protein
VTVGRSAVAPGLELPICVTPCRVARMNTRKDILTMPGNHAHEHAHEYVGRHRKPEHDPRDDPPTDPSLHRAYELFTHGTQPIHITKQK